MITKRPPAPTAESEAPRAEGNRQVSKNQKQKRDAPKSYTRDTLSSLLKRNKYNEF